MGDTQNGNYDRRKTSVKKQLMLGYPYTLVLGVLIVLIIIVIPIVKAPILIKRYKVENLKVMIRKGQYEAALSDIEEILQANGIDTKRKKPWQIMSTLFVALVWVLNSIFKRNMSKSMQNIVGTHRRNSFEITVHATDISIAAKRDTTVEIMALLSESLEENHMYFSWDDHSQQIEDRIKQMRENHRNGKPLSQAEVDELAAQLRTLGLSKEEWNAIRRQLYRLECEFHRSRMEKSDSLA
ncbi:MAG TPA: hypothetical protein VFK27_03290 [Bacillales bacterium]|nr:hypothetical protein [Bacillales bacterium]